MIGRLPLALWDGGDPPAAAPGRLCLAQSLVGAGEEGVRGRARREVEDDPNACPDFQGRRVPDRERLVESLDDPGGDRDKLELGDLAGAEDGELVTADAGKLVGRAYDRREAPGDHARGPSPLPGARAARSRA